MTAVREQSRLRELAARRFEHPVVSLVLDLDPARFATAPARATEINSLLDEARRAMRDGHEHADQVALEHDVAAIERHLTQELDPSGAAGVVVYACEREDLFDVIELTEPVRSKVVIDRIPHLEPLLPPLEPALVAVALVNRRDAQLYVHERSGTLRRLELHGEAHGRHRQGGWSEANYERSIEDDVDKHLRASAEALHQLWRQERFQRVVLGGPHEVLARLIPKLHGDLQPLLQSQEIKLGPGSSTSELQDCLRKLRRGWRAECEEQALHELLSRLGDRPRAVAGVNDTVAALNEQRAETLILSPTKDLPGGLYGSSELLEPDEGPSSADGEPVQRLQSLRAAIIRQAIRQDATVVVLSDAIGLPKGPDGEPVFDGQPPLDQRPEVEAFGGIGAVLRF